ncbi:helix-turn-helix domain-containing protein [Actinomadura rudentiformis]|uniref:Helix-turn-helix domain-containing protein n=1 Tax=Actinomadura rudentiformis TaxID=359158 RepID=A0A6H9YRK0_9ACTN|nr:XRE family transcriptional regulator [Actinomadura rudentiformis]KAB2343665.1 helix-turn-helix domain-containing protein [Actinomadura rudentiformis]
MPDCVAVVAGNLRRLREERALTLGALAERSGVAKGTVSALERGHGNPTIETLFALAYALDVTLADLVEEPEMPETAVVRAADRPMIPGTPLEARLLRRSRHPETTVEVYELLLHPGADHRAKAHRAGTRECMYVIEGEVETGLHDEPVRLGPGDFASFPADAPHDYRSHGAARALLIMTLPKRSPAQ